MFKDSVRTAQYRGSRLLNLNREIIAAFIETRKDHRSSLCVQNIETLKAKPGELRSRQLGSTGLISSE